MLLPPSSSLSYPSLQFISILCDSLYNKPVNTSISLNSVSCLSQLIEPEEGEVGTLIYSLLVRSTGKTTWGLRWASEAGRLSLPPWALQPNSVRTDLN